MPIELSTEFSREPVASCDTVVACLSRLKSENGVVPGAADENRGDLKGETVPLSRVVGLAAKLGFRAEWTQLDWAGLKATGFTNQILALRRDNDAVIVTGGGRAGAEEVSVWDPHHDGVVFFVPREDFERHWNGHTLIITPAEASDEGGAARPDDAHTMKEGLSNAEGDATAVPASPDIGTPGVSPRLSFCLGAVVFTALCGLGSYYVVIRGAPPPGIAASTPTHLATDPVAAQVPSGSVGPATALSPTERGNSGAPGADIAPLLARGDDFFRKGDLAAARLFYRRAVEAGDGQAAIRLGETFDPEFLERAQLRGAGADIDLALTWYRRARDLGAAEAELLLRSLEGNKTQ